ncbi:hypothetical protein FIBSPDRAFT_529546 [Athelia psychrophila]|uniref:Uncharacterized protein n=1 Tax=Athelia psychrophila TaxID=1759441 RepID=A0A166JF68_9AGAM|nr:hypothetical protein FIBSPDRAFT_529546 [Fibularhizoctonia sp. CBS 109695]
MTLAVGAERRPSHNQMRRHRVDMLGVGNSVIPRPAPAQRTQEPRPLLACRLVQRIELESRPQTPPILALFEGDHASLGEFESMCVQRTLGERGWKGVVIICHQGNIKAVIMITAARGCYCELNG